MQNLFEILRLTPTFVLDAKALEASYFAAQRLVHPDRLVGKPDAERVAAFGRAELVNDAYDMLKNPLTRAQHLLELQGIHPLAEDAVAPPALLMEMMELREQIADAAEQGTLLAALVADLKARAAATQQALAIAFASADYPTAAIETMRLHYLGKAMEEAHMLIYRLKAGA